MNMRIPTIAASTLLHAVLALLPLAALADATESPRLLVATQGGRETFGEAVLLVVPLANGAHYGFVLNQPTETPLAALMPEDEASQGVSASVHLGGPMFTTGLFALVREDGNTPGGPRRITPGLSVALDSGDVDLVIAQRPGDARFFLGLMVWNPGELEEQVRAGAWQVLAPDPNVVLSTNPANLWQRLSVRATFRPV
jgi:putative transcriptional regulator